MAPFDPYLMHRNAEIALSRTAAPESISRDVAVLIFGRHNCEAKQRNLGVTHLLSGRCRREAKPEGLS